MTEPGEVSELLIAWAKRALPDTEITRCDCDRAGPRWEGQHLCSTGEGLKLCFYIDELSGVCVILSVTLDPRPNPR